MVYIADDTANPTSPRLRRTGPASPKGCAGTSKALRHGSGPFAKRTGAGASKEEVLKAVRGAVEGAGGRMVSLKEFLLVSGMEAEDLRGLFTGWDEALRAAGFVPCDSRIDPRRLLGDWGKVARRLRRVPSRKEYDREGKYGAAELTRRFGAWTTMPGAFRAFAGDGKRWRDVLALFPESRLGDEESPAGGEAARREAEPEQRRVWCRPGVRLGGRPVCGDPLGVGAMRNAPMNEQGVVFLFAILAEGMGFHVEALQAGFPDCEARRRVGTSGWQARRIEFEYESRNFHEHGHAPEGCDMIVCWVHNWAECPKHLEVIELSKVVKDSGS